MTNSRLQYLEQIENRLMWLSAWIVHNANHRRPKEEGDVKVGGHQASCASMTSIMTALYFDTLKAPDRVAVKPHASPVLHAIHYLAGKQPLEKLENFRGFGGAQSYPSRTKDGEMVDFSTGSVGLGVAQTAFASIIQDYLQSRELLSAADTGRMVALVGDAELDEGNIYECLQEGWKHNLRNTWWIVDYNRQSLDGVVCEGLWSRIEKVFESFGWNVLKLQYGAKQRAAFGERGGEALRNWINDCPNQLYSALTFKGGAAWRERLVADFGKNSDAQALLDRRSDTELSDLMNNLGGHCLETLSNMFQAITDPAPTMILAYTIKGWKTPLAGHKDNHAGLMTVAQMNEFQQFMGIPDGEEWRRLAGVENPARLQSFIDETPFFRDKIRRREAARLKTSGPVFLDDKFTSTQAGFGKILDALAKQNNVLSQRILTTSPDVTVSTNLGGWVNRKGLFSRVGKEDMFRIENIPSMQKWTFSPSGQHIELGIAEMNLFLMLSAGGLAHALFGERLIPIGTLYDPFIARGLDALNYACYQDARFIVVGTPSGVSLAPEGGAHQSIGSPLIGIGQPGLASFEPAFVDELSIILDWAFDYLQRSGDKVVDPRTSLCDAAGGSVYLRLTTKPLEQPHERDAEDFRRNVINGAYWLRRPGPNCELVIAYQGCVANEAIDAAGRIANDRRDIGVLAVTSADRLYAGWKAAKRIRANGNPGARCHVENLLHAIPRHALLTTVTDGHSAALSWMGAVAGHAVAPLGVENFGQTGSISDLYRHFEINSESIVKAAAYYTPGRPLRAV